MQPVSLGIFEDGIYWADWDARALYVANKFSGKYKHRMLSVTRPVSVLVHHESFQKPGLLSALFDGAFLGPLDCCLSYL